MVFEILGVNLLEVIKRYEFKGVLINNILDSSKPLQEDSQGSAYWAGVSP